MKPNYSKIGQYWIGLFVVVPLITLVIGDFYGPIKCLFYKNMDCTTSFKTAFDALNWTYILIKSAVISTAITFYNYKKGKLN
jgi:hypothetical protein